MDAWTAFSLPVVEDLLPTDVKSFHAAWVGANPDRAGRLAALVQETARLYRQAVAAHPDNTLPADETLIPVTGFRHAVNMLVFNLTMEMGAQVTPEVYTLVVRADIWLRLVQQGRILPDPAAMEPGWPSYARPGDREQRPDAVAGAV